MRMDSTFWCRTARTRTFAPACSREHLKASQHRLSAPGCAQKTPNKECRRPDTAWGVTQECIRTGVFDLYPLHSMGYFRTCTPTNHILGVMWRLHFPWLCLCVVSAQFDKLVEPSYTDDMHVCMRHACAPHVLKPRVLPLSRGRILACTYSDSDFIVHRQQQRQ